jgi:hypothetical protein
MDLSNLGELAASRDPLFWAASAAIAMGAGCLTASLVLVLRRARLGAGRRRSEPQPRPAAVARATGAADQYVPLQPARAMPRTLVEAPSLALLLRRLQAAGDRLEDIAADLDLAVSFDPDSLLKEPLPDVEYVFKASGS